MENKTLYVIGGGLAATGMLALETVNLVGTMSTKKAIKELEKNIEEETSKSTARYQEIQNDCKRINEKLEELKNSNK